VLAFEAPDRQRIFFHSTHADDEMFGAGLYTIRSDGTGLMQLIARQRHKLILRPSFSPDGTSITLAQSGVNDAADIAIANTAGTTPARSSPTAASDSSPEWQRRP
jgi:Tol biopolymer transport system component